MLVIVCLGEALKKCTRGYRHLDACCLILRKSNSLVAIWVYNSLMPNLWKSSRLAAAAIFLNPPWPPQPCGGASWVSVLLLWLPFHSC